MLFDAGGNREDVRIENDVLRRKSHFIDKHAIGAFADLDFALEAVGLSLFVEGHDNRGCTVGADETGLFLEFFRTFLEADRVDDALALDAAQTGLEDFPFRGVDHHRHTGNVGFAGNEVEELRHGCGTIEHAFVHVHIDDLRPGLDLLARYSEGFVVVSGEDEFCKFWRARHIRALADIDEGNLRTRGEWLKAAQS